MQDEPNDGKRERRQDVALDDRLLRADDRRFRPRCSCRPRTFSCSCSFPSRPREGYRPVNMVCSATKQRPFPKGSSA